MSLLKSRETILGLAILLAIAFNAMSRREPGRIILKKAEAAR